MKVYITKSNANRIFRRFIFNQEKLVGDIYKEKNRVLNAMYSKYEKSELLAYKKLMEDPDAFMMEFYKKIPQREDSYWWVFEENNSPAYHFDSKCPRLRASFKNYKIPAEIRFKGISKDENVKAVNFRDLDEEGKIKVMRNVRDYRQWWAEEGGTLFLKDKDVFLMRVNNKFRPEPRIRSIAEFEAENSGTEEIDDRSLVKIENKIDQLIKESGIYYYESNKNTKILKRYAWWSNYVYKNNPFPSNDTGYTDEEIRETLKDYNNRFKNPLAKNLKEYYRRKNNPDLTMEDKLLDQLGFRPCSVCIDKKQNQIDYLLEGIDYSSDEALALMMESDIHNDMEHWEDLARYEDFLDSLRND